MNGDGGVQRQRATSLRRSRVNVTDSVRYAGCVNEAESHDSIAVLSDVTVMRRRELEEAGEEWRGSRQTDAGSGIVAVRLLAEAQSSSQCVRRCR